MYEFLRKVPLFADLPDDDLERLCEVIEEVPLEAGQELFAEGSVGDQAFVIKQGHLEVLKVSGEREVLLAFRRSGPGAQAEELHEDHLTGLGGGIGRRMRRKDTGSAG